MSTKGQKLLYKLEGTISFSFTLGTLIKELKGLGKVTMGNKMEKSKGKYETEIEGRENRGKRLQF